MAGNIKLRRGSKDWGHRYYVDVDGVNVGWVVKLTNGHWASYVLPNAHAVNGVEVGWGFATTRREAVDEVMIQRKIR